METITNSDGVWEVYENAQILAKPSVAWLKANQPWFNATCLSEATLNTEYEITLKPLFETLNISIVVDGVVVFSQSVDMEGVRVPLIFNEVGYKKIELVANKGTKVETGVMVK